MKLVRPSAFHVVFFGKNSLRLLTKTLRRSRGYAHLVWYLFPIMALLSGCKQPPPEQPPNFYIAIGHYQLLIPALYMRFAGLQWHLMSTEEHLALQQPPGLRIPVFFIRLDLKKFDLADGETKSSDIFEVRISPNRPDSPGSFENNVRQLNAFSRTPSADIGDLKSYSDKSTRQARWYIRDTPNEDPVVVKCGFPNAPQPSCELIIYQSDVVFNERLKQSKLADWQIFHQQLITFLNKFQAPYGSQ